MVDSDKDPDPAATPGEPIRLLRCQRAITAAPRATISLTSAEVSEIKPNSNNIMSETRSLPQLPMSNSLLNCCAPRTSAHPYFCAQGNTCSRLIPPSTNTLESLPQISLNPQLFTCHASRKIASEVYIDTALLRHLFASTATRIYSAVEPEIFIRNAKTNSKVQSYTEIPTTIICLQDNRHSTLVDG